MSDFIARLSRRGTLISLGAGALAGLAGTPAFGQPDRPVRFILPVATGTGCSRPSRTA